MPVDPGNLLILGELDGKPVIGAPGCARSPKENGFDWVLERLMANVPVTKADIVGMGVGGLADGNSDASATARSASAGTRPDVAIAVLAAGQSTRMNGPNKLLATFDDVPLIRRSALTAIEAGGHSGYRRARPYGGAMQCGTGRPQRRHRPQQGLCQRTCLIAANRDQECAIVG